MIDDPLAAWAAAIAPLDERLRPIATRTVDLTDPDWAKKFPTPRQPPLDEAGIRDEAQSQLAEIVDRYPTFDDATRQRARELFQSYHYFAWATSLPYRPTDAASLRKHLVLVAIHDQDDDPRDTIVWMDHILREARDAGVDVRPEVQEVAKIASDVDRWRYGSTRKLMLAAGERWGRARG